MYPCNGEEVAYSEAELYEMHERVARLLGSQDRSAEGWINGVGIALTFNRVSVDAVGDATVVEDDIAALAPADAICLEVAAIPGPAVAVPSLCRFGRTGNLARRRRPLRFRSTSRPAQVGCRPWIRVVIQRHLRRCDHGSHRARAHHHPGCPRRDLPPQQTTHPVHDRAA